MSFSKPLVLACLSLPFSNCQPGDATPKEELLSNKATFTDATETEKRFAIERALGFDATLAFLAGLDADLSSAFGSECPKRIATESTVTYIGEGCTTNAGQTYTGRLVATNMPAFNADLGDANAEPMTLEFLEWSDGEEPPITGRLWQSEAQPTSTYQTEIDFSLGTGIASVVSLKMDCEIQDDGEAANCRTSGDVELTGIGAYLVNGTFMLGNAEASGAVTLLGEDELRVDFDSIANGCAPVLIDDAAAGSFCKESLKEGKQDSNLAIEGHSIGCVDDLMQVEVYANLSGTEAQVLAYTPGSDIPEIQPLPLLSTQSGSKTFHAKVSSDILRCSDLDQINFVMRVFDANDYIYCAASGPDKDSYLENAECDARYAF